jgi:hypothetical protein
MRRQQLTEAQIAALFDPPTNRRELERYMHIERGRYRHDSAVSGRSQQSGGASLAQYARRPATA